MKFDSKTCKADQGVGGGGGGGGGGGARAGWGARGLGG